MPRTAWCRPRGRRPSSRAGDRARCRCPPSVEHRDRAGRCGSPGRRRPRGSPTRCRRSTTACSRASHPTVRRCCSRTWGPGSRRRRRRRRRPRPHHRGTRSTCRRRRSRGVRRPATGCGAADGRVSPAPGARRTHSGVPSDQCSSFENERKGPEGHGGPERHVGTRCCMGPPLADRLGA